MVDSAGEMPPLSMRNVTDFTLKGIQSYDVLRGGEYRSGVGYISSLGDTLRRNKLTPTDKKGSYLQVYQPSETASGNIPVAVKVFDTKQSNNFLQTVEKAQQNIRDEELSAVLDDETYIRFANRKTHPKLKDLTRDERAFLFLAWEHKQYETLYKPFVLPGVFIAYNPDHDIAEEYRYDKNDSVDAGIIEMQKELGIEHNEEGQRLLVKKGETAFTMVQDFKEFGPSIFQLIPADLSKEQKQQLVAFANLIDIVHKTRGYLPDETMDNPVSSNVCFTKDLRLVLADTNHIRNEPTAHLLTIALTDKIRQIASL